MLAETCKGVLTYFYTEVVTLHGIDIHLNVKQCDGSRCLLLRIGNGIKQLVTYASLWNLQDNKILTCSVLHLWANENFRSINLSTFNVDTLTKKTPESVYRHALVCSAYLTEKKNVDKHNWLWD